MTAIPHLAEVPTPTSVDDGHMTIRANDTRRGNPAKHLIGVLLALTTAVAVGCADDTTATSRSAAPAASSPSTSAAATKAGSDTTAFCAAGAELDARTSAITSPEQAAAVFAELGPTLDTMRSSAPDSVADAAEEFVSTAKAAVRSGDFTAFEDGTVDALVKQFEAVCARS